MRSKKPATASPRSVRYLLSADRKLRRLSLKKIATQKKHASRTPRRGRSGTATRESQPTRPAARPTPTTAQAAHELPGSSQAAWLSGRRATIVAIVCILGVAALIGVRQPSRPGEDPIAQAQATPVTTLPELTSRSSEDAPVRTPPRPEPVKKAIAPKPAAAAGAAIPAAPVTAVRSAQPSSHAATADPSATTAAVVAPKPATEPPKPAAPEPAPKPAVEDATAPVTITGCLQLDDDTFWLKDPSGVDAPTTRSWKSGFLRKRPAPIELVGSASALKLSSYVGQRIAATGTLVNRELHPRSLHRVASSCE